MSIWIIFALIIIALVIIADIVIWIDETAKMKKEADLDESEQKIVFAKDGIYIFTKREGEKPKFIKVEQKAIRFREDMDEHTEAEEVPRAQEDGRDIPGTPGKL